jgi:hypothetical protein
MPHSKPPQERIPRPPGAARRPNPRRSLPGPRPGAPPASMVKVSIKWGKEVFPDVEADPSQPPMVFKSQLYTLTSVPPERQKVMIKGALLKDDEWGKAQPKEGMTIMLMGTAGEPVTVEAPKNAPVFVEDLPEEEQDTLGTKAYGSGLANLGNTCYMNSTVQCLYSVAGLQEALARFGGAGAGASASDPATKLVVATKELFADLKRGGSAFPPFKFLLTLRERFPQFAQTGQAGEYMQQDAEECYSQIMYTLREKLKVRARGLVGAAGRWGGGGGVGYGAGGCSCGAGARGVPSLPVRRPRRRHSPAAHRGLTPRRRRRRRRPAPRRTSPAAAQSTRSSASPRWRG